MMKLLASTLATFASLWLATSAHANSLKKDAADCDNIKDFQLRVDGCTRLLNNPKLPPKFRSVALQQRAQGYGRIGKANLALPDLDALIRANPKDATLYLDRASTYGFVGPTEKAIEDAEQAIRLNPKLAKAHNLLAQGLLALGEKDRALAAINKALEVDPRVPSGLGVRATIWASKKEYDRALSDADEFIRQEPKATHGYSIRAYIFAEMTRFDDAIADSNRLVDLALAGQKFVGGANASPIYNDRANVYFKKGDFDKSIADFDQALRLDPQNAASYVGRADCWRAKGNLDKAVEDLERAIRVNPKLAKAYTIRGAVYEAQGESDKAKKDYEMAVSLPNRVGTQGVYQVFIDTSFREKETATTRLAVLNQTDSAPTSPPPQRKADSTTPGSTAPQQRIALVIGNSAYKHAPPLANPANDAKSISKNLRDIGFEVFDGLDLDRAGMKTQIGKFIRAAATANVAVLFYAGHGMQIDGRNYLVPTDLDFADAKSVATEMPDLDFVLAGLDDKLRTNIIILDACRDNPMVQTAQASGTGRSVARSGLAAPAGLGTGGTVGAGTLLAFATAPGQVALDGDGTNSPFSTALARHIATPGIEVQQMLTRVRADVVASTKSKQVPWSNSSLLGEVFLVKAN